MSAGPVKSWQVGIASGASTSSYIDLGNKAFTYMALYAVTMSTGAAISVFGAYNSASTFFPCYALITTTSTVAFQQIQVATSTSGGWGIFQPPPFPYLQFCTSAVVSGGASLTIMAFD